MGHDIVNRRSLGQIQAIFTSGGTSLGEHPLSRAQYQEDAHLFRTLGILNKKTRGIYIQIACEPKLKT
jgi:hypothetical protein